MPAVTATFETRREAELAIEHLVQEHQVEREDIVGGPKGGENSVGSKVNGSDHETELDGSDDDEAALNGAIAVAVTVESEEFAETLQEVLEEFGGDDATVTD